MDESRIECIRSSSVQVVQFYRDRSLANLIGFYGHRLTIFTGNGEKGVRKRLTACIGLFQRDGSYRVKGNGKNVAGNTLSVCLVIGGYSNSCFTQTTAELSFQKILVARNGLIQVSGFFVGVGPGTAVGTLAVGITTLLLPEAA